MLNFGKFLHSETSAIGLTSLGLARKISNKTQTSNSSSNQTLNGKTLQQNMNAFSSTQSRSQSSISAFNLQSNEETLNSLFGRNSVLNFNNGKLIG